MTSGRQFEGLENAVLPARPVHLAVGMFDGVHLGHRAVIETAVQSARQGSGVAAVLTFWPHPSAIFHPEGRTPQITDPSTKTRILLGMGVDAVIVQPFTVNYARTEAEEFIPSLLKHMPRLTALYVGENWRFGKARRGDVALLGLETRTHKLHLFSAPRVNLDGAPISSTRIRDLLVAGDMHGVNAALGYNYFADGVVVGGKHLGRTLGFPTLNIGWAPDLCPRLGVYAVRVRGAKSPAPLPAVANFGLRPTVGKAREPLLEVHIIGDCPYGEGDAVSVDLLHFLRPEAKFASLDDLRAQIASDREAAKTLLG